jgi:hypothetical protein
MGRVEEAQLAIQLVLRPGELLETGKARVMLGPDRGERGPDDVAGLVPHRGWSLRVDSPGSYGPSSPTIPTRMRLRPRWASAGVLTVPIRPQEVGGRFREQDVRFVLEISK